MNVNCFSLYQYPFLGVRHTVVPGINSSRVVAVTLHIQTCTGTAVRARITL
jgi:hypothetical protein